MSSVPCVHLHLSDYVCLKFKRLIVPYGACMHAVACMPACMQTKLVCVEFKRLSVPHCSGSCLNNWGLTCTSWSPLPDSHGSDMRAAKTACLSKLSYSPVHVPNVNPIFLSHFSLVWSICQLLLGTYLCSFKILWTPLTLFTHFKGCVAQEDKHTFPLVSHCQSPQIKSVIFLFYRFETN